MFKIFRRNTNWESKPNPSAEKAASMLAKALLWTQRHWANWLNAKEQKMSLAQKKATLVLFCAGMALLAGLFLYRGLCIKPVAPPAWLKPPAVIFPEDARLPDSLNLEYLREVYKQKQSERLRHDSIHN
jgi:hypothetical protein